MRRHSKIQFGLLSLGLSALVLFIAVSTQSLSADPGMTTATVSSASLSAPQAITSVVYFPFVAKTVSCPISGGSYGTVAVLSAPTDRPAEVHADLNLAMRGYTPTVATLGLVDLGGPGSDPSAPQLYSLFTDNRVPIISRVYRVYDWDWNCNCRGAPLTNWQVTLSGMGVAPGEPICTPTSGYDIGHLPIDYEVMVLYASTNRITLKYTRDDNVVSGYTIHIENINVDSSLLALYQSMNSAGRSHLPALFAGQHIGRAMTTEVQIAIRDTGEFMDPRSHKDWWQGK